MSVAKILGERASSLTIFSTEDNGYFIFLPLQEFLDYVYEGIFRLLYVSLYKI